MPHLEDVQAALRQIKFPGFSRDIVSFGVVREVVVESDRTRIVLAPPQGVPDLLERIRPEIEARLREIPGLPPLEIVEVAAAGNPAAARAEAPQHSPHKRIPGVRTILAVASGKGGVGKSTVASNIALALAAEGLRAGLLDADVYGPSTTLLLGVEGRRTQVTAEKRIVPVLAHGISMVSMGLFVEREQAVIWRGPMVTKLVREFLFNVEWGDLDVLVLDLPPGTGDVQLTLAQQIEMDGGLIVTTPQEVALADVRRGMKMFQQMKVPVLGVLENMSGYVCPHCDHETAIFGRGGGQRLAAELSLPYLGSIPLIPAIGARGDEGTPIVASDPASPAALRFRELARTLSRDLGLAGADRPAAHSHA